jgi:hypothetical protein
VRKPNSNSVLKTLPAERQADIFERLNQPAGEGGGYAATVKWLKEDGVTTSKTALSEFFSWYSLSAQLARNASTVETLLEDYVKDNPELPPEKIQAMGQAFFSAMSLAQQDPAAWVQVQRLNLQRAAIALDERRIALLEKKAAQADATEKVLRNTDLTPEERASAIKEIYGR